MRHPTPPRTPRRYANAILASLDGEDLAAIEPHLRRIDLPVPRSLEGTNRRIATACFPEEGIASVVASSAADKEMEVGLIGYEGMTGLPLVLGGDRWPYATFMQVPGWGHVIDARALAQCQASRPRLNTAMLKSVQAFMVQVGSTATSRIRGRIDERLARWILMAHDRVGRDEMALTHRFLAVMLGVRRPGVTVALQALADKGLVATGRGTIKVIDRAGLEEFASSIYGAAELEHKRLFPAA